MSIQQQLAALYVEGVTDYEILEALNILPASELLEMLREIKPAMTPFAIYKRIERGQLEGRQIRGRWWVRRDQADAWLSALRMRQYKKE